MSTALPLALDVYPPLTAVSVPQEELGRSAVRLALHRTVLSDRQHLVLGTHVVLRGSTRRPGSRRFGHSGSCWARTRLSRRVRVRRSSADSGLSRSSCTWSSTPSMRRSWRTPPLVRVTLLRRP